MTVPLVWEAPRALDIGGVEDALFAGFEASRQALAERRPVVIVVTDGDLLGHGEAADAAVASALVGMVRSLATEGEREGWQINVLADSPALVAEDREEWIGRLARPQGMTGALVRLGSLHLGRVPV